VQSTNTQDGGALSLSNIELKESSLPARKKSHRPSKAAHIRAPAAAATQTSLIPEVISNIYAISNFQSAAVPVQDRVHQNHCDGEPLQS
jgi:hypothetical protein